jgi:hypothetical protein
VVPADGVGLGAQANVVVAGEGAARVLQGLAEWRAAVPGPVHGGADVQMGVDIDDANLSPAHDIAQVVPKRGFVTTAEHHGNGPALEQAADDLSQRCLRFLQSGTGTHIAGIKRWGSGDVYFDTGVPGDQSMQPAADLPGRLGRPRATMVAPDALVMRKADQDDPARLHGSLVPAPGFEDIS